MDFDDLADTWDDDADHRERTDRVAEAIRLVVPLTEQTRARAAGKR